MIKFNDRSAVGSVKQTKEGFLVATARVARTGVQEYLAAELGDVALSKGFHPQDVVRVYRHEDQVFDKSTLNSVTRVPVTLEHPKQPVDASNWSDFAVGEVGDSYTKDGEWIVVNPMIKDAAAIKAAQTTHKEISMGYEAEIVQARDGIDADFEMKNIRMNHLALVRAGRAGSKARIGDSWGIEPVSDSKPGGKPTTEKGGRTMSDQLKTVVLGDQAVQVSVSDVAAFEKFKADSAKAIADAQSKIDAKDEEIGKLKVQLDEAKKLAAVDHDALAEARAELVAKVKAIDSSIETKGKSSEQLRKEAVAKRLGDEAVKDASDAEISGMFKAIRAYEDEKNPVVDTIKEGLKDGENFVDSRNSYLDRLTRKRKE